MTGSPFPPAGPENQPDAARECVHCGETKPLTEYHRAGKGFRRAECRDCTKQIRGDSQRTYQAALRRLRENHRAEFSALLVEERHDDLDGSYEPEDDR